VIGDCRLLIYGDALHRFRLQSTIKNHQSSTIQQSQIIKSTMV
jgi:hypothetical protein